ncbi:MAG TPA: M28 family peptidase, partial [Baekduia sp.]|nr:M28 family peptidase [Baekduia sp.]
AVAGGLLAGLSGAAMADIVRSPHVPGANDNLSACACLVALARAVRERPLRGLRVLLVSAGAEETLQEGIRGLAPRLLAPLPKDRTWVLNLDTVGSPHLVMLEGEGPLWMEDYTDPAFRDLVARCAAAAGVPMRRGMRARSSTDGVIASRIPLPTATLVSLDDAKMLSNYHLMSDVPENVDLGTVAEAATVAEAVARALAAA